MTVKALILFSGGLDSILAAKILREQKIELLGIIFKSYFFDAEQAPLEDRKAISTNRHNLLKKAVITKEHNNPLTGQAKKAAKEIGLPLKIIDFSKEHLKMVKNPKYGYGKAMNPCIDCHILMLRTAKEIAGIRKDVSFGTLRTRKSKFDFLATGDVLGERPMSQNKQALEIIEKKSGLTGYLLRPLSAKLLKPTIPEKLGWVAREKLLDISGRSRKRQIALAKKYKIKKYPTPAGGCLLADLEFGKRLKELLKIYPKCDGDDIELLKLGRHFLEDKAKIVVGRNEEENKKIKKLKKKGDVLIELKNYPAPLTIIRNYGKGKIEKEILGKAKKLTQYYSLKARFKKDVKFDIMKK